MNTHEVPRRKQLAWECGPLSAMELWRWFEKLSLFTNRCQELLDYNL